jgi:GH24 family phage-related lysozyme (muramidase)
MVTTAKQSTHLPRAYNGDAEGRRSTWDKTYLGFVRDNADQQYMGRLKVYIPELCGIDREDSYIICDYASPFGGTTSVRDLSRNSSSSQTSYGMWFVPPDRDNQVLVMFINGDPNRGVWIACLHHVDRHRMVPSTPGNSGSVSEPSPLADVEASHSPPSTPVAAGVAEPAAPMPGGAAIPGITATQESAQTATVPVLGPSSYSSANSYHVNGINTPGGNRLVLSDQVGDTQIRLATRNNMQLILHNETGIAVLMTGDGKSRIELHRDGTVFLYGEKNINIRSKQDVNIHADRNVNIQSGSEIQTSSDGATKFYSKGRMNLFSDTNMHLTSLGEHHRFSNGNLFDSSSQKIHRRSNFGIFDSTPSDINQFAGGSMFVNSREQINIQSGTELKLESTKHSVHVRAASTVNLRSTESMNLFSSDSVNIQSAQDSNWLSATAININSTFNTNIRSNSGTVNLESVNANVYIKGSTVYIGTATAIDAGVIPGADSAEPAAEAESSLQALLAQPAVAAAAAVKNISVENVPQSSAAGGGGGSGGGGGGTSQRVVSSVASQLATAEPATDRFVSSPGYSNTDTVERADDIAQDWKSGQIDQNQTVPLQVMGFVGGATILEGDAVSGLQGISYQLSIAVQAMKTQFGLSASSLVRKDSNHRDSQHRTGNAADFSLRTLSPSRRQQIVSTIVAGATSGRGPFRFIRGIGTYNETGDLLHIDVRQESRLIPWGPTGSIKSIGGTPAWFQALVLNPQNPSAGKPCSPALTPSTQQSAPANSSGEQPQRYNGEGYEGSGVPRYIPEPVPNSTFNAANTYSISDIGLSDISNFETLRGPRPDDIPGRIFENLCGGTRMIGYGHKLTDAELLAGSVTIGDITVSLNNVITADHALALLKQDIRSSEALVKSTINTVITQQQFDALVDFAWNVGERQFRTSNVVKYVNDRKYDLVPTEMIRWVRACGTIRTELQSRRRANALRFSGILRPESSVEVSSVETATSTAAAQTPRAQQALAYFVSQGWSREQAAGIVGNLIQESGLNPAALNPRENAQGIAQWTPTGERQAQVAQFLGKPILQATFEEQLSAVQWELNNSARSSDPSRSAAIRLRATTTTEQATDIVNQLYERSRAGSRQSKGLPLSEADQTDIRNRRDNARTLLRPN